MKSATCAHLTIIKNVLRAKTLLLLLLLLQRNTTLQNPPFCMQKKTFSFFPPSPKMDFASTPSLIDFQTTFIIIAFFSYLHNWLTWQHNTTKVVSTNPKRVFHKIFWNYNCAIQIGDVSSRSFKTSTFCCILNLTLIKESLLSFHLYFVTKLDVKKVFLKTLSI